MEWSQLWYPSNALSVDPQQIVRNCLIAALLIKRPKAVVKVFCVLLVVGWLRWKICLCFVQNFLHSDANVADSSLCFVSL